uniref:Uncharacterized protein n=1 Tax=Solanum tuberosum TaxID=4113 RepID=M1DD75_SOLTU
MNTQRVNPRRVEEENVNQGVPLENQVPQGNQDSIKLPAMSDEEVARTNGCYGFGTSDHQVKERPTLSAKGREAKQASLNGTVPITPNYGSFYALRSREDKQALPDEGTGMLIVPYGWECFIKIMLRVGEGNSSNDMRNVEVFMHNGFVDVVPTSLCCTEYIEMELMFPPCFVHCYDV